MSDDLVKRLREGSVRGYRMKMAADLIEAQAAEIARLRAAIRAAAKEALAELHREEKRLDLP